MSWHHKENPDSEMYPRKQAPIGHGLHTIARIQPMVPEVSQFPSETTSRQAFADLNGGSIKRLASFGAEQKSYEDSLCRTVPILRPPPQPQQAPMRGTFKASDQSQLYNEKSWLSVQAVQPTLKASKSENFDKEKALLNQPEDLYKVLNWQSDQLVMLKEQVRLLMSGQQQDTSSTKLTINESGHNLSSASMPNLPRVPNLPRSSRQMVDTSTQMSAPSSPAAVIKKLVGSKTMMNHEERSELRNDDQETSFWDQRLRDDMPSQSLPLGASAGKIIPTKRLFGEHNEEEIICDDVQPIEDIDQFIGQFGTLMPPQHLDLTKNDETLRPKEAAKEVDCNAIKRLRQMEVSFLTKEDIFPTRSEAKMSNDPSSWYPQATDPFQNNPPVTSTSDYSLMLNTAALKYLDDAQMTHIAMKSPRNEKKKKLSSLEPANVTLYGLPENTMSIATRDFFSNNQFMTRPDDDKSA